MGPPLSGSTTPVEYTTPYQGAWDPRWEPPSSLSRDISPSSRGIPESGGPTLRPETETRRLRGHVPRV